MTDLRERALLIINSVLADGGQPLDACCKYVMEHLEAVREEGRREEREQALADDFPNIR